MGTGKAPDGEVLASGLSLPGQASSDDMLHFMTLAIKDVSTYWAGVWKGAGYPASSVYYAFPAPGETAVDTCEPSRVSDDTTAEYCSENDTIIVSQAIAVALWNGQEHANDTTLGYTTGDFSVAYAVAHEYAHSLQEELGILPAVGATSRRFPVYKTELHADCWAGVWASSAYYAGALDSTDIQEGIETANDLGDNDLDNPRHHGTPQQRVQAFVQGYQSGQPKACDSWLLSDYS